MPNGFTNITTSSTDYVSLYIYVVEGAILMTLNTLCALLIFTSRNLREQKEYIIFAGNMIYDALFGLMYFLAGVRRLTIYYGGEQYIQAYSRWDCFTVFHTFLFIVNTPTSGIMSFLSCLDRFISVTYPTKYLRFTPTYGYLLILITFFCSLPTVIVSGILVYRTKDVYDVNAMCQLQQGIPFFMFYVLRGIRIMATLVGIFLYICIAYRIYQFIYPTRNDPGLLSSVKRKRLITMTFTFLLITLNQLFLFVAPDAYLLINTKVNGLVFYVMNMNKGIVNIIIFLVTQKELRNAVAERMSLKQKSIVKFVSEATTRMPDGFRTARVRSDMKTMTAIK